MQLEAPRARIAVDGDHGDAGHSTHSSAWRGVGSHRRHGCHGRRPRHLRQRRPYSCLTEESSALEAGAGRGERMSTDDVAGGGPIARQIAAKQPFGPMERLGHDDLVTAQRTTLATPRRHAGLAARALFVLMDVVYGTPRTLEKFRVLELVARVPYQAWENVAYVAVTHTAREPGFARRVFDRVRSSRWEQDNEQWHLLILEELTATHATSWVKTRVFRRSSPSPTTSCPGSRTPSDRPGRIGSTPTSRITPSTSTHCSSRSTRSGSTSRTRDPSPPTSGATTASPTCSARSVRRAAAPAGERRRTCVGRRFR